MEDREIVQQLIEGDRAALAAVYDRYAQRLYDYCIGMLKSRDSAADAVHDTLLVAADRAHQLRDPDRLRPWLYAIARNECLRALRAGRRETGLDAAGDVGDASVDVERGLRAAEAHALVHDAAAGLNAGDREVLDLNLRHELAGDELAAALGVSANHANALLSRARTQLERAVGALVMARTGQQDCAELASILAGWDGALTALVRKRVSRHIERCEVCGVSKQRKVSAAALFSAVPLAAIPIDLRSRVLDAPELEKVAYQRELGKRAEPFNREGFPVPLDEGGRRTLVPWLAAGLAVLLLIGAGAMLWRGVGTHDTAWMVAPPSRTVEAPTPSASASASPSGSLTPTVTPAAEAPPATATPSTTPTPSPSVSPSASPSPSPTSTPPVLTIRATGPQTCGTWTSTVTGFVTSGTAETVTAFWQAPTASGKGALRFQRAFWIGELTGLPTGVPITIYAVAVNADGLEGRSNNVAVSNSPCPD